MADKLYYVIGIGLVLMAAFTAAVALNPSMRLYIG